MSQNILDYAVQIGDYEWFPVKQIGDKYFVIAIKPLFKGYYSFDRCAFAESRLCGFLNSKFTAFLVNSGIEAEMLSGISIPTQGQYNLYVKNKLPKCGAYLLQTPGTDEHSILAIQDDESIGEVVTTAKYNIRPCMFVDAEYLEELAEHPIKTTESYFEAVRAEQEANAAQIEAEAKRKAEEEAARIAAEAEAARIAAEEAEKARAAAEAEAQRLEAERKAAEEKARLEAEERARQQAAEEERKRKAEEERQRILEAQRREQEEAEKARLAQLLLEKQLEEQRKAEEEARANAERERLAAEERQRQLQAEAARKAAEEQRIKAEAEAKRRAEEAEKAAEAARIAEEQKREAERQAEIQRKQKEAERLAKQAEEERIRKEQEAAARVSAVVTEPLTQDIVLPQNVVVEYDDAEKEKPAEEKTAAVYMYGGIYKDYAFLVSDGDEHLKTSIEKMGLAIRDYMNSATNEARNPMKKTDVMKNIEALQNRWRW